MSSPILERYRENVPAAQGLSDEALAEQLREKFYPDADPDQFKANIGVTRDITERRIDQYRAQVPQAWGMNDQDLVTELHSRFGQDQSFESFAQGYGVDFSAPDSESDGPRSRAGGRGSADRPQAPISDADSGGQRRQDRRDRREESSLFDIAASVQDTIDGASEPDAPADDRRRGAADTDSRNVQETVQSLIAPGEASVSGGERRRDRRDRDPLPVSEDGVAGRPQRESRDAELPTFAEAALALRDSVLSAGQDAEASGEDRRESRDRDPLPVSEDEVAGRGPRGDREAEDPLGSNFVEIGPQSELSGGARRRLGQPETVPSDTFADGFRDIRVASEGRQEELTPLRESVGRDLRRGWNAGKSMVSALSIFGNVNKADALEEEIRQAEENVNAFREQLQSSETEAEREVALSGLRREEDRLNRLTSEQNETIESVRSSILSIAENDAAMEDLGDNALVRNALQSAEPESLLVAFSENPLRVTLGILSESAVPTIASLAGGAVGAKVGAAAGPGGAARGAFVGMGVPSGAAQFATTMQQVITDFGGDWRDPDSIIEVMDEHGDEIARDAGVRGAIAGVSYGLGGSIATLRLTTPARPASRASNFRSELGNLFSQTSVQAAAGAGQSYLGQGLTQDEINAGEIYAEIIGEAGFAPLQVATLRGAAATRDASGNQGPQVREDLRRRGFSENDDGSLSRGNVRVDFDGAQAIASVQTTPAPEEATEAPADPGSLTEDETLDQQETIQRIEGMEQEADALARADDQEPAFAELSEQNLQQYIQDNEARINQLDEGSAEARALQILNERASDQINQIREETSERVANEAIDRDRAPTGDALGQQVEVTRQEAEQAHREETAERMQRPVEPPQEADSQPAAESINLRTNGEPFATETSARSSGAFREARQADRNPEVVPVEGGFGWREAGTVEQLQDQATQPEAPQAEPVQAETPQPETAEPTPMQEEVQRIRRVESPVTLAEAGRFPSERVSTASIQVDPETYQFRTGVDREGVDERLAGIQRFDDLRAGTVILHERSDGQVFVADGHHRVNLARNLDRDEINAIVLREEDGFSVADARRLAAERNIAEENATPIDAAKVFREFEADPSTVIQERDLPRRSQVVQDGIALAQLGDNAFGAVLNEQITEKDGAAIGRNFSDPNQQLAAVEQYQRARPSNEMQRELLAGSIREAGFTGGEQGGLFGDDPSQSLVRERIQLQDAVIRQLTRRGSLMRTLNENAAAAERAGNVIARGSNEAIQDNARLAADLVRRADTIPEINQALNEAAQRFSEGESIRTLAQELANRIENETNQQGAIAPSATPGDSVGSADQAGQEPRGDQPADQRDAGPQAGGRESGLAGQEQELLTQPTPEDIQAQEQARAGEQVARAEDEQRAEADQAREDFTLTGSERDADQAAARGQDPLFSLDERIGPRVSQENAQAEIDRITAQWQEAPATVAVDSEMDLPSAVKQKIYNRGAMGRTRGVFHEGTVYVVAENIPDAQTVESVVLHEVIGHFGLRRILGDDLNNILDQAYLRIGRSNLTDIAQQYDLNLDEIAQRREAVEEYLARFAESPEPSSFFDQIVALLTRWARGVGFNLRMSDAEIRQLLVQARRFVSDGEIVSGDSVQLPVRAPRPFASEGASRLVFGGERGRTADLGNLEAARSMRESGQPMEAIRSRTGWFVGADGRWRYEIDDSSAALADDFDPTQISEEQDNLLLGDILDHDSLYAAYPDLRSLPVSIRPGRGYEGAYNPGSDAITMRPANPDDFRSTLLHEVQHAVQHREGFAVGGNTRPHFIEYVRAKIDELTSETAQEALGWEWANQPAINAAGEASDAAFWGLVYQSVTRLREYAQNPGRNARLIRRESEWVHDERFARQEVVTPDGRPIRAEELGRGFYDIPSRSGAARNEALAELANDIADFLIEQVPRSTTDLFRSDDRLVSSIVRSLERDARRARERTLPLSELRTRASQAADLRERSRRMPGYEIYRSLAGEVEARNVQARADFTSEDRQAIPPDVSQDTSRESVIVSMGGLEMDVPRTMAATDDGIRLSAGGRRMSRQEVMKPMLDALGVPGFWGRTKRRSYYIPEKEVIRIRDRGDVEATATEAAYLLNDRIPEIRKAWTGRSQQAREFRNELRSLSETGGILNGYSNFMKLYLTENDSAQSMAPAYYEWFEGFLDRSEYGEAIRESADRMAEWNAMDILDQARSKVGFNEARSRLFDRWQDRIRQSTYDDFHAIWLMENDLEASGIYENARLIRGAGAVVDGALHKWGGVPFVREDGSFGFKGKSLDAILEPVSNEQGSLDDFLLYALGQSASELMMQGRENLFTQSEIKAMKGLETPARKKAFEEYQEWNRGIVDFAQDLGLIDPEQRATWRRSQYIPMYRMGDQQQPMLPRGRGRTEGQFAGIKALTGGTGNVNDILGNIVQNAAMLIEEAIKNNARVQIANAADDAPGGGRYMEKIPTESRPVMVDADQVRKEVRKAVGAELSGPVTEEQQAAIEFMEDAIENVPDFVQMWIHGQAPGGKNVVSVMREGKPEYYEIADPFLQRSMMHFTRPGKNPLVRAFSAVRRLGQSTVTLTLDFMAANFLRDTVMASVLSDHGFRPFWDSAAGMKSRYFADENYREFVANGGGMSSLHADHAAYRKHLKRFYQRKGINWNSIIDSPGRALYKLERAAEVVEMGTRAGYYQRARQRGETPQHAAYLAREIGSDYAMRGDSPVVNMLYDTVMFLKAGQNGLDRIYRGVVRDQNRGAVMAKAGALALASAALYMHNRDIEEYDQLEDWDKDVHWHFFVPTGGGDHLHLRYPKIWQVGAFASMAERSMGALMDSLDEDESVDGKKLLADMLRIFRDANFIGVMPQVFEPIQEQLTNRNAFTGAPIEPMALQNMDPWARARPMTSQVLQDLGEATRNNPRWLQVNPVRAEALIRGYTNTWGFYGLQIFDATRGDNRPQRRVDEMPVLRRFVVEQPARRTRFETEFYNMHQEIVEAHNTMTQMINQEREDRALEIETSTPILEYHRDITRAQRYLSEIRNEIRQIQRSEHIDPEEKRRLIDQLQEEINDTTRIVVEDVNRDLDRRDE